MMNLIAITLVVSQLAVAGLFSPSPHKNNNGGEQVIVKDGHRAVVVEYADTSGEGGNTKVSITPPLPTKPGPIEDQLSRAGASVAGVAQKPSPGEVICDAYGKCKHVISGAWGKAKDKAAEEDVKEVVEEASTEGVRQNAKEKVSEAGEMTREMAEKVKGKTGEVVEETVEKMKQKGREGKKKVSDIAKRGKEVVSGVMRYMFWPESVGSLMNMIHMIGFAMAYGISMWVTFIMSHVLAGVLSRQQFGMVQSKIYPVYFRSMVGSLGLALLGHLLGRRSKVFRNKADMVQAYNLMGSLLSVLANLLFLEPKATKAMFRRMKMEKEEGRGRDRVIETLVNDAADPISTTSTTTSVAATSPLAPPRQEEEENRSKMGKLNERLKKLNSYSSLLNIMTLMGLTWHLVYLSQRLSLKSY